MQKRILTIQDYSVLGRCSLTVALPIISSLQIECVGLPTAVLSNHTAFPTFSFVDLTDHMLESVNKWDGYNNNFDMIYTGYLAKGQVDIVLSIIKKLKRENTIIFIDPAFGESGKLYKGFDKEHVDDMKRLVEISDYLLPNLTEACYLTDTFYQPEDHELAYSVVDKLLALGAKNVVLTGVKRENNVGCLLVNKKNQYYYGTNDLKKKFHGTGDVFSSALAGSILSTDDITKAIKVAHEFTSLAMQKTIEDNVDGILYGPEFEKAIPFLVDQFK